MSEPKSLSYAALREMLDNLTIAVGPFLHLKPTRVLVHPSRYKLALKVLRGSRWHHKHTARWHYLVRRGARKC